MGERWWWRGDVVLVLAVAVLLARPAGETVFVVIFVVLLVLEGFAAYGRRLRARVRVGMVFISVWLVCVDIDIGTFLVRV